MKLTALVLACLISGSVATKDWETFKAAKAIKKESIKAAKGAFKAAIKAGKNKGGFVAGPTFPVGPDLGIPQPIPVGPAPVCNTVFDEVWEEKCFTKYDNACHLKTEPRCTTLPARECHPKDEDSCSFVMEQKCTRHPVPFCDVVWEKQCSNVPVCSTVFEKACHTVEKDVCVTHFQKACQTTTVKECRHEVVTEPQRWRRSLHEKFAAKKAEKLAKKVIFFSFRSRIIFDLLLICSF